MGRRTILPRSALQNSDAVTSQAPIDPVANEEILGPESQPTSEPTSEPSSQPSSQPSPDTPQPPANPNPLVLLVHPPSTVLGAGIRGDAEGPIFARDPLMGADTLLLTRPLDFPERVSLYTSIGRLVIFVRRISRFLPSLTLKWNGYRADFAGYVLPSVTNAVEFEAPHVGSEIDTQALVNFAKMFNAPKCVMWSYAHGAEVLLLRTKGKKEKEIEKQIKPHQKFLLERTPDAATIVSIASGKTLFEIATEWFDPSTTLPDPPRPKKGVLRRTEAVQVFCKEPDYSSVDFNEGAKLQRIEVEIDPSIPLPPVKR